MEKILNKKLKIIGVCIGIALIVSSMGKTNKGDIIQTMAVPVTNKVIVVDAGHGRRRPEER